MIMIRILLIVLFTCSNTILLVAQPEALRAGIEKVLSTKDAIVGVAIKGPGSSDTLSVNGNRRFPMQSVFKFHIALAVLHDVEKGKLKLDTPIPVDKSDLLQNTHSPLRDKYPNGGVSIPLTEILQYTVSFSDNSGCDILLKLIGGPEVVNDYIHSLGVRDVSIVATEKEMHSAWDIQFNNWSTPKAAVELLQVFYREKVLSKSGREFLWKAMTETPTGKNRIRGQLPSGTVVGDKTGTSGQSADGIMAAVNDMGIVLLPEGKHYTICIFVSNSREDFATNEKIIAEISKLAWDYFTRDNQ